MKFYPGNKSINIFYAETLVKAKKIKQAHSILQSLLNSAAPSKEPELYRLLAETQAKLKMFANSHQSLAEYYYLLGQTHEAIKQLEISLKTPKLDFYTTTRLEARLKDFKSEIHKHN